MLMLTAARGMSGEEKTRADVLHALIQQRVEFKYSVGIAAGIIDETGSRVLTAGTLSKKDVSPVTGDSVFEIGSISKAFTGVLLAAAIERGDVKLDDAASTHLKATKIPQKNGEPILLRHLAQHTSALPRMPTNFAPKNPANPYADYTVEDMYAFVSVGALSRSPGQKYDYSNLGMGLLGHLLAVKAGMDYEKFLESTLCEPLRMKSTAITLTPDLRKRLAFGHNGSGVQVENWDFPTLAGAGAIRSTVNDMLLFARANLSLTETKLKTALEASHASRFKMTDEMSIALGWHVLTKNGTEIIWHNGQTGGYHSFIGLVKATKRAVVILSNSELSIDDIGFHLLEPRIPLEPRFFTARKDLSERQEIEVKTEILDGYVGHYELAPGFVLSVTKEGKSLTVQATGQPRAPIFAESEKSFFYKIVDAQIVFTTDANGKAKSLTLYQGGAVIPSKRLKE